MVERYVRIRSETHKVEAVDDLVLTGSTHNKLLELLELMKKFKSVTKRLQRSETTMAEVRLLFDSLLTDYPSMSEHLKAAAKIVHSPVFESAVVKHSNDAKLTAPEVEALAPFVLSAESAAVSRPSGPTNGKRKALEPDYAELILRAGPKQRKGDLGVQYSAIVKMIPPTSNLCERLFSECRQILTPQRSEMRSATLKMIAFLRVNRLYWGVTSLIDLGIKDSDAS